MITTSGIVGSAECRGIWAGRKTPPAPCPDCPYGKNCCKGGGELYGAGKRSADEASCGSANCIQVLNKEQDLAALTRPCSFSRLFFCFTRMRARFPAAVLFVCVPLEATADDNAGCVQDFLGSKLEINPIKLDSGMVCKTTLPGPVTTVLKMPSPPSIMFLMPLTVCTSTCTEASIMAR